MHIATIRSLIHHRVSGPVILDDEGFYELEVHVDLEDLSASGDPQGFANKTIAQHLAQCARTTSVPMYENLWLVQCSPWAQNELAMPQAFTV